MSEASCAAVNVRTGWPCDHAELRITEGSVTIAHRDYSDGSDDGQLIVVAGPADLECIDGEPGARLVVEDTSGGPRPLVEWTWAYLDLVRWRCFYDQTQEAIDHGIVIGDIVDLRLQLPRPTACDDTTPSNAQCFDAAGNHSDLDATCCLESGMPTDNYVQTPCG